MTYLADRGCRVGNEPLYMRHERSFEPARSASLSVQPIKAQFQIKILERFGRKSIPPIDHREKRKPGVTDDGNPAEAEILDHRNARFQPTLAYFITADGAGFCDHYRNAVTLVIIADHIFKAVSLRLGFLKGKLAAFVDIQKLGRPLRIKIHPDHVEVYLLIAKFLETIRRGPVANQPGKQQVVIGDPTGHKVKTEIAAMLLFTRQDSEILSRRPCHTGCFDMNKYRVGLNTFDRVRRFDNAAGKLKHQPV